GIGPQIGKAIAEIGGRGADGIRRHARIARRARLPTPLGGCGAARRRNRAACRRLKQAHQEVVRLVLRVGQIGAPDHEQRRRCEVPDGLGNGHGENSQLRAAAMGPREVTETLTPPLPGCRRPHSYCSNEIWLNFTGLCSKPMRRLYLNKHFGNKAVSMPATSCPTSNSTTSNGPA